MRFAVILLIIYSVTLCSCDIWRIVTTANRKESLHSTGYVENYCRRIDRSAEILILSDLNPENVWLGLSKYHIFNKKGQLMQFPVSGKGCSDRAYDLLILHSLSSEVDSNDFTDTIYRSWVRVPNERMSRKFYKNPSRKADFLGEEEIRAYACNFGSLNSSLNYLDGRGTENILEAEYTILIPFILYGRRRLQTVVLKELLEDISSVNGLNDFKVYFVYLDKVKLS